MTSSNPAATRTRAQLAEPVEVERIDFRRGRPQLWRDAWRGGRARVCRFTGTCALCGTRCYEFDDGENDPRGALGDHAGCNLDPDEYGQTGAEVVACFLCQNDTEGKYRRLLARAVRRGHWTPKPGMQPVDTSPVSY